jgi:sugar lactone lactonase YvrE
MLSICINVIINIKGAFMMKFPRYFIWLALAFINIMFLPVLQAEMIIAHDQNGHIGDDITITFSVSNAANTVSAMGFDILYDPDVLEYIDFSPGPLLEKYSMFYVNQVNEDCLRVGALEHQMNIAPSQSGDLMYLKFHVIDFGTSNIDIVRPKDDVRSWQFQNGVFSSLDDTDPPNQNLFYQFKQLWPALKQPWYFYHPMDIAVDAQGFVYVADTWNDQIQKLTNTGQIVTKWGMNGSDEGQFQTPVSIATYQDKNTMQIYVFVVDQYNHRIQKFTDTGDFILSWGSYGSEKGQFQSPSGIAVGKNGIVYVADTGNSRIQTFTVSGEWYQQWTNTSGIMLSPCALTLDSSENVYVADSESQSIITFTNNGQILQIWRTDSLNRYFKPSGIAYIKVDQNEILLVSDSENNSIQSFKTDGTLLADHEVILQKLTSNLNHPVGIAANNNKLYIADASNNRIISVQISPEIIVSQWGSQSTQKGFFIRPNGIIISENGLMVSSGISVVPQMNHLVQQFTTTGTFIEQWPNINSLEDNSDYLFNSPSDMAYDGLFYYVLDSGNHRLLQFDTKGHLLDAWGKRGDQSGEMDFPCGMAMYDAYIYIADTGNHRIQVFDQSGTYLFEWGEKGTQTGQFLTPKDIDIDSDGVVYIADTGNHRIQCFSMWGDFIRTWGAWGDSNSKFDTPSGITVHSEENIVVVADTGNHRCQVFDKQGSYITKFGSYGSGAGQFHEPFHVAIDVDKNIFITDRINNRIQKFQPVTLEGGITKAIIVVGDDTYGDALFQTNANLAYRALNYQGINKNNIYYLSKDIDLDLDDNGVADDIDGLATNENLQIAVTRWAIDAQHVIIYLIGHNDLYYRMNTTEILDNTLLDQWMDQLQLETGCRITFIFDACKSGNYVQTYSAPDSYSRVVIMSTGVDENAYLIGAISFSNYFWTNIFNGHSIQNAFQLAAQTTAQINQPPFMATPQNPSMDANNNGIANEPDDYSLTHNLYLGSDENDYSETIRVVSVSEASILTQGSSAIMRAEVISDTNSIQRVWAVIRQPDYQAGVSETIEIELISVGNNWYQSVYQEFDMIGTYLVAFYAQDDASQTCIPQFTTVSVNTPMARRAVIVVGNTDDQSLDTYYETIAANIYDTLIFQGYTDETLYLLTPNNLADGWDGFPDANNIQYALGQWTQTDTHTNATQDFVLCFLGKTIDTQFMLTNTDTLTREYIDTTLEQLENQIPGDILLISDMPDAWEFISQSAQSGSSRRIHISGSSDSDLDTIIAINSISFSTFFWQRVLNGFDVKSAFKEAKDALSVLNQYQNPCIDANGNGNVNEYDDYVIAREFTIGYGIMRAQDTVTIASVMPTSELAGETHAIIWAEKVISTSEIESIWAIIVPPGFEQDNVLQEFPQIELTYNSETKRYEATYYHFELFGEYRIAIYATSKNGMTSVPAETLIYQTKAPDPYEKFTDDALEQAQVINVNAIDAQHHNFHDEQDRDWVKFFALAGNIYRISASNADLNCDPVLALYDKDGVTKLEESNYGVNNEQEVINWTCSEDGVYYVLVYNFNKDATDGQDTGYDIRINMAATIFNGTINGYVRIIGTEIPIGNAIVRTSKNLADISLPTGTYRIGGHESGEALIFAEASGFCAYTASITVNPISITRHDIYMTPENVPGDLNSDGIIDLKDAILTGYILTNMNLSGHVWRYSDISGDGKIGLEEMIFILNDIIHQAQ